MDQQKQRVVHEIKVSKPLMVFLWVMGIGILFQQPVGKMLIPEAVALTTGDISYCWDRAKLEKQSNGDFLIRTYC